MSLFQQANTNTFILPATPVWSNREEGPGQCLISKASQCPQNCIQVIGGNKYKLKHQWARWKQELEVLRVFKLIIQSTTRYDQVS